MPCPCVLFPADQIIQIFIEIIRYQAKVFQPYFPLTVDVTIKRLLRNTYFTSYLANTPLSDKLA